MNGHINNNARYLFDSPFSFYMICLQLCSMVRDMSVKVRIEVFSALGKIEIVSEYILLQTLSKKASSATKEMNFPGQYADKIFRIPASSASFAFLHGLEDEFSEVMFFVAMF